MSYTPPIGSQPGDPSTTFPSYLEENLSPFYGPALPLTPYPNGRFGLRPLKDLIKSSIVLILNTPLGTALHSPEFGSALSSILFDPNDAQTEALATFYITTALEKWEPRINLVSVFQTRSRATLNIVINYTIKATAELDELRLAVDNDNQSLVTVG
jgi:phage baseplate assembly protein W